MSAFSTNFKLQTIYHPLLLVALTLSSWRCWRDMGLQEWECSREPLSSPAPPACVNRSLNKREINWKLSVAVRMTGRCFGEQFVIKKSFNPLFIICLLLVWGQIIRDAEHGGWGEIIKWLVKWYQYLLLLIWKCDLNILDLLSLRNGNFKWFYLIFLPE